MTDAALTDLALSAVLGAVLVAVGCWGVRHADTAAPCSLPTDERDRRAAIVRRGGWVAVVVGVVLVVAAGVLAVL